MQWGFRILIRLDVLFNNSGIAPKGKKPERLDQISPEEYRNIMSINTDGQVYVMQAALKLMIEVQLKIYFVNSE